MRKFKRVVASLLPVMLLLTFLSGNAGAALKAVGPTDPVTTLPAYYQDLSNLALQPCLDQNGFCILTPNFDPAAPPATRTPPGAGLSPITTTGPISPANFPDESFYFIADSTITTPTGAKLVYRAAMEAAFLAGVSPNTGITFLRINMKQVSGLAANTTYTVTHPYGSFQFTTDATGTSSDVGGAAFRTEDPLAPGIGVYFPPEMQGATTTHIGPFLQRAAGLITDVATGNQYIGDPALAVTVTGSPFGTNFFRVDGPNINPGATNPNSIETSLFNIAGRVFTGTVASPMTIDKATYARDATTGRVDIFVTALPTAVLTLTGTGIPTTVLAEDVPGTGKYFASLPFTTTLPTGLSITNSLDVGGTGPIPHPVTLVDEVNITTANYDPIAKTLTIKAASRDKIAPPPTLTATQFVAPNTLDATGTLVVSLPTTIPPLNVVVQSSKGGEAIALVSVVVPSPPPVPVAPISISPTGPSILSNAPFLFSAVSGATSYKIYYENLSGVGTFIDVTPAQAGCVSGTGVCSFTPATPFTASTTFGWLVSALNAAGQGPWSATLSFVTAPATPAAPTAISPTGPGIATNAPFTFSAVAGATGYIIYSENLSGVGGFVSVSASQAGCPTGTGTCSYTPATPFTAATTFGWLVAAQNLSVQGPFSATLNFTTQ